MGDVFPRLARVPETRDSRAGSRASRLIGAREIYSLRSSSYHGRNIDMLDFFPTQAVIALSISSGVSDMRPAS